MIQGIDTIPIEYLQTHYIKKEFQEKTGIFNNKTNTVERIVVDYDKMELLGYPGYVIECMKSIFNNSEMEYSDPDIDGMNSVEFTLNQFIEQHRPCKIISVIHDSEVNGLCIVWEEIN